MSWKWQCPGEFFVGVESCRLAGHVLEAQPVEVGAEGGSYEAAPVAVSVGAEVGLYLGGEVRRQGHSHTNSPIASSH